MTLVKVINNKHRICFDSGKFDSWCVYLTKEDFARYAPVDSEYFTFLQQMGKKYGNQRVYDDFIKVYDATWIFR